MKTYLLISVVLSVMMLALCGCDSFMQSAIDPNSGLNHAVNATMQGAGVVNSAAPAVAAVVPIAAPVLPWLLGFTNLLTIAGGIYQTWQKSLLSKTTRAIVRGVEQAAPETQEVVKPLIRSEMESAAILTQGKAIVAGLKNG